jgi:hypothetical protein
MAFLKRKSDNPVAALERELSDLTSRRDQLDARLATARTALASACNDRRATLLDASLDDEAAAHRRDTAVRDARDQIESLDDALSEINSRISDAEAKLAELRDRAERAVLVAAIERDVAALTDARDAHAGTAERLIAAVQAVVARVPCNPQFAPELVSVLQTIPAAAISELLETARSHVAGVVNGVVPGVRPAPPPPPEPPAPKVERQTIYVTTPIRWKEGSQIFCSGRYSFADAPRHVSEIALSRGFASLPDAEITSRTVEAFGVFRGVVSPESCLDLDALLTDTDTRGTDAPVLPPGFVETIGKPRTGLIDGPRV